FRHVFGQHPGGRTFAPLPTMSPGPRPTHIGLRLAIACCLCTDFIGAADALGRQHSSLVLVQRVIDGDTISLASIGRVHLLGVSAMKLGSRPATAPALAREAQQRLASLLSNRWVRIEYES